MNDQWQTVIRMVLKFGGGCLVSKGYTDADTWTGVAGAVLAVIGFIWGLWHRTPKAATAPSSSDDAGKPPTIFGTRLLACMLIAVASAVVLQGCVNKPQVTTNADGTSVTNFVKGPDVARISRLAGGAAQIGTQLRLAGHPEDRQIFETTRQALQSLADAKNYDPAAFSAALSALPVKTLQGEQGAIYISGAILIWDEAIAEAEPLTRQELVAATLTAVAEGIGRGLAATAAPGK